MNEWSGQQWQAAAVDFIEHSLSFILFFSTTAANNNNRLILMKCTQERALDFTLYLLIINNLSSSKVMTDNVFCVVVFIDFLYSIRFDSIRFDPIRFYHPSFLDRLFIYFYMEIIKLVVLFFNFLSINRYLISHKT